MNRSLIPALFLAAAGLVVLPGCGQQAKYVQPDSSRLVTRVGEINIQDFARAADVMVQSLIDQIINPGKLHSGVPNEPALLGISRIVNNTGQHIDTDLLVKKIRVALLQTGKVQTSSTIGLGEPEDPLAKDLQATRESAENRSYTRLPDYTLFGKIIENRTKTGNLKQSAYVFQMGLTSPNGVAVWEAEETIIKQGTRSGVGF
jgi:hypothetical protein